MCSSTFASVATEDNAADPESHNNEESSDSNSESETNLDAIADNIARKRAADSHSCLYAGDFGQVPVCCAVGTNLSNSDKYLLLMKQSKPECTCKFPDVPDNHGQNRCFQLSWLQAFPGLVYSPSLNGGFFKYCVLFGKVHGSQPLGVLVSRPLTNFRKATEILKDHLWGKMGMVKYPIEMLWLTR